MPSVRCARRWWKIKRGVNDPGAGLRLSPHPRCWGSFTPRVSLLDEALVWCSIVPENLRDRADRSDADSVAVATSDSNGHHVRNRARSTRRRTRFSAVLRPGAFARGSRVSFLPARPPGVGVCETLTAPRPSAAIWQLRDGRKTPPFTRVTRWRCAVPRRCPANRCTRCAGPGAGDRFPPWTTRAG
jgi:hypothetical protein